jgi:glycogen synthase
MTTKRIDRRLLIVVRADPVICGHSGEARNLAEAAAECGYTDIRILSWPIDAIEAAGLPTKPLDSILPYSHPIVVERPEPVGDYRAPDGRYTTGLKGRLVELLLDGMDTVVMSLYLMPHTNVVTEAVAAARATGLPLNVKTIAEAVGSDITNVVRSCVAQGNFGPAVYIYTTYLASDVCVAVSEYTKDLIVESAEAVDRACKTHFAEQCRQRVAVSYPALDTGTLTQTKASDCEATWVRRGLQRDQYILFLSRIARAKGVDDLINGYRRSNCYERLPLVIAGNGPALDEIQALAGDDPHIQILTDVDDDEKRALMLGCAAYVLPSKPRPEFVETFGIALAEKMLVGGHGPVLTTDTGGIPEAVGDGALHIDAGSVESIRRVLDRAILEMSELDRQRLAQRALHHALQFDRRVVFDRLVERVQWSNIARLEAANA